MIQKYYEGTPKIINLSLEVGKLIGVVDSTYLRKPPTNLRRENRIKTIQSSLMIEGNTLSLDQVTAIFENKRIVGPAKDIMEVQNAIEVYNKLRNFNPYSEESYLAAHRILMSGLVDHPGKYRTTEVGIFKGEKLAHMAPPAWNVRNLMGNLFSYLKKSEDSQIVKSCVFHYEMEFIHPFMDGNGRMGRLWQTLLLMQENPVFEYLPLEKEIKDNQEKYYEALAASDKEGLCTRFIEFMLGMIKISLSGLIDDQRNSFSDEERLQYFKEQTDLSEFTRKDYLRVFKDISTATATRDLKKGVNLGMLKRKGENRLAKYVFQ